MTEPIFLRIRDIEVVQVIPITVQELNQRLDDQQIIFKKVRKGHLLPKKEVVRNPALTIILLPPERLLQNVQVVPEQGRTHQVHHLVAIIQVR